MQRLGGSIDSLPTEILLEIIKYVFLPRKKKTMLKLCLISRRFSDLACPLLFSRISLGGFTSRLRDKSTQLKALSKGDTKASALAKHLSIDYSSSFSNDPGKVLTPLEGTMLKYLQRAIGSFKGITTMSWQIGQYEPLWLIDSIINSLAAIPTLKDINLSYLAHSLSHLRNLDAFSDLHKIRVRIAQLHSDRTILEFGKLLSQCPDLTDFHFDIFPDTDMSQLFQFVDQAGISLSLQHLSMNQVVVSPDYFKTAIQHLRSLQSLYLYRCSPRDIGSGPTIWEILIKERIYIQNLSTDAVDDSLLRYLSSFQELRNLTVVLSSNQLEPVNILRAMNPHHAESLTKLDILVNSDFKIPNWSPPFSENIVNLLSSFNNLRCFALQLHVTPDYIPIVKFVLPTCTKIFPKLERLVLHTPHMTFHLQNPHIELRLPQTSRIHDAIVDYKFDGLIVPSFEVYCERFIYKPRKNEITGSFSYVI